jgi:hypothetical protein
LYLYILSKTEEKYNRLKNLFAILETPVLTR